MSTPDCLGEIRNRFENCEQRLFDAMSKCYDLDYLSHAESLSCFVEVFDRIEELQEFVKQTEAALYEQRDHVFAFLLAQKKQNKQPEKQVAKESEEQNK